LPVAAIEVKRSGKPGPISPITRLLQTVLLASVVEALTRTRAPSLYVPVSDLNAAAIGLGADGCGAAARAAGYQKIAAAKFVAKNSKKFEIGVDTLSAPRLYTPHQRRRRRCWRPRSSLLSFAKSWTEFKRAAWATLDRPEAKSKTGHDIASAMSVLW